MRKISFIFIMCFSVIGFANQDDQKSEDSCSVVYDSDDGSIDRSHCSKADEFAKPTREPAASPEDDLLAPSAEPADGGYEKASDENLY